jgi:hypothetical protein
MKRLLVIFFIFPAGIICAQENYEIQVYSSPTQAKRSSIFELHSNFTFNGEKQIADGVLPSHHSLHETVEITTGIADNFELGFYLFTNYTPGHGLQVVGTHIRPRVTAPLSWKLPVGLSLSAEIGYQKSLYSSETWNMEIRPIIDKTWNKFYISFNPTLGISVKGVTDNHTPVFEPNLKMSFQVFKTTSLGAEYYGSTGYINNTESFANQEHALYFVYDLTGNPKWELNLGVGTGLTAVTDKWVAKVLIGRRINWKSKK